MKINICLPEVLLRKDVDKFVFIFLNFFFKYESSARNNSKLFEQRILHLHQQLIVQNCFSLQI